MCTPLCICAIIIMVSYGLLSTIAHTLLFVNIAMPGQDLPLELLGILVPDLCSFAVQW
jgi:hypothetical protein